MHKHLSNFKYARFRSQSS